MLVAGLQPGPRTVGHGGGDRAEDRREDTPDIHLSRAQAEGLARQHQRAVTGDVADRQPRLAIGGGAVVLPQDGAQRLPQGDGVAPVELTDLGTGEPVATEPPLQPFGRRELVGAELHIDAVHERLDQRQRTRRGLPVSRLTFHAYQ